MRVEGLVHFWWRVEGFRPLSRGVHVNYIDAFAWLNFPCRLNLRVQSAGEIIMLKQGSIVHLWWRVEVFRSLSTSVTAPASVFAVSFAPGDQRNVCTHDKRNASLCFSVES